MFLIYRVSSLQILILLGGLDLERKTVTKKKKLNNLQIYMNFIFGYSF